MQPTPLRLVLTFIMGGWRKGKTTCCASPRVTIVCLKGVDALDDERLTFKEMCAAFDVTPRTLRYYEYIELLQPHREGRSRFYGPRERARMKLILRGRKFGFALEDIRQWLLIYEKEGTEAQMRTWVTMADGQLEELAEQRRQLDEAMAELQKLRDDTAAAIASKEG
jgi:DNA-binding transcriptional MerR regulator|tara:strand:- start:768 stop:1268 length:501 start_codon:yes stop_codon:yes gene_type:complete